MKLLQLFEDIMGEKKYSPLEILEHINDLHEYGWEETNFEDKEWVFSHKYFILKDISLNDPNVKWNFGQHPPVVKQYAELSSELPPIVIGSNGYIMDGTHRSGAAKLKGLKTIKAFIGIS